mmetsp:Transcript_3056/g.5833  ORF Transcript_3056/g.5833 Transcript_3056/m.5833 type:complete len:242 (+) Transcript_3056:599-1324(+)
MHKAPAGDSRRGPNVGLGCSPRHNSLEAVPMLLGVNRGSGAAEAVTHDVVKLNTPASQHIAVIFDASLNLILVFKKAGMVLAIGSSSLIFDVLQPVFYIIRACKTEVHVTAAVIALVEELSAGVIGFTRSPRSEATFSSIISSVGSTSRIPKLVRGRIGSRTPQLPSLLEVAAAAACVHGLGKIHPGGGVSRIDDGALVSIRSRHGREGCALLGSRHLQAQNGGLVDIRIIAKVVGANGNS